MKCVIFYILCALLDVLFCFIRNENYETTESKLEDGVNVPIWRRDAPRVKHIRGIFLEDDTKPNLPLANASSANAQKGNQPKAPANMSNPGPPKQPPQPVTLVCPKCKMYKTKNTVDMKVHLFNEFNYQRYEFPIIFIIHSYHKLRLRYQNLCSLIPN